MIDAAAVVGVEIKIVDEDYTTTSRVFGTLSPYTEHRHYAYVASGSPEDVESAVAEFARLDQKAAQVVREAEMVAGQRCEWTRQDGRWVIIGMGLVAGAEVVVSRANGTKSVETVKRIVGERGGMMLAETM